jgi:hypothetical protein
LTEAEWDLSQDATAMLQVLRGRSGERKLRLLACACARSRWSGLVEEEYRRAVEIAERCADGLAERDGLRAAWDEIWYLHWGTVRGESDANGAAAATIEDFPAHAAARALSSISSDAAPLIREIFGNPFRAAHLDANWLKNHRGPARDIAERIYDDRRFEDLPRLADLLAETGCPDGELLAHLRSSGPHFRGCWALDAILGRGEGKDPVTEEEWFAETHPFYMLTCWEYLRGEPSLRKRRLIACASCRLIWPLLADARLRRAVEVAEEFADGLASTGDLARAREPAHALGLAAGEILGRTRSDMPEWAALRDSWRAAHAAASAADEDFGIPGNACHYAAHDAKGRDTEDAGQAKFLREILGNPLRQVAVDPVWLHRNDGAVRKRAQAIYDERAFEKMPLLADVLEKAGCFDEEMLSHCRKPGQHVRGCWLLDLVLGKD